MNFQQLCSQQQLGFFCNSRLLKSFLMPNQPQSNGLNTQNSAVNQGIKFPQVPSKEHSFTFSASGSLSPKPQGDQGSLTSRVGDDGSFGPILKPLDNIPKTSSNELPPLLQKPENKPAISPENSGITPLEPSIDNNIPVPKPPSSIESPVPFFPEVKPAPPTDNSGIVPIEPEVDGNIPLPKPPNSIEFPYSSPTEELDTCNKASLSSLINSIYCPQTKEFRKLDGTIVKASSLPGEYRVLGPRTITIANYIISRANIYYTPSDDNLTNELAEGKVTKITCG